MLPAHETFKRVAIFHARAGKQPVLFVRTGPIGATVGRRGCLRAHESRRIGTMLLPRRLETPLALRIWPTKLADAFDDAICRTGFASSDVQHAIDRVAAEKCCVHTA